MRKQTTCYICDELVEPEWLPVGEFIVCNECSSKSKKHAENVRGCKFEAGELEFKEIEV